MKPHQKVPEWAMDTAVAINNRYELGLRDNELRVLAWFIHRKSAAAAPDMLAALARAVEYVATIKNDGNDDLLAQARAAIAKANGETA